MVLKLQIRIRPERNQRSDISKTGGEDAVWVATKLNSGNICYINSFAHAVAWMLDTTGGQVYGTWGNLRGVHMTGQILCSYAASPPPAP